MIISLIIRVTFMVMQQDMEILKSVYLIVLLSFLYSTDDGFAGEEASKIPPDFFEDFVVTFKPQVKYSPADEPSVETESLPYWLQSWKDYKKQMEEKHGTSISILLDDHHQHILNGPGSRKGRNIFWWNLICSLTSSFQVGSEVVGCFLTKEGAVVVVFALGDFGFNVNVDWRIHLF